MSNSSSQSSSTKGSDNDSDDDFDPDNNTIEQNGEEESEEEWEEECEEEGEEEAEEEGGEEECEEEGEEEEGGEEQCEEQSKKRRRCNELGDRPSDFKKPEDTFRMVPQLSDCLILDPDGKLYDEIATFSRIYGAMCISSTTYNVPEAKGDGLHPFFMGMVIKALGSPEVSKLPQPAYSVLIKFKDLLESERETPGMKLRLPQLYHMKEMHTFNLHEANARFIQRDRLCAFAGDQFLYNPVGSSISDELILKQLSPLTDDMLPRGTARLELHFEHETYTIELKTIGKNTLTLETGYDVKTVIEVQGVFDAVLNPSAWLYRETLKYRAEYADKECFPHAQHDPLNLLALRVLATQRDGDPRWSELIRIFGNASFRSDGNFELSKCDTNGLWSVDTGSICLKWVCMQLQINISQLQHSPKFQDMLQCLDDYSELDCVKQQLTAKDKKDGGSGETVSMKAVCDEMKARCSLFANTIDVVKVIQNAQMQMIQTVCDPSYEYDTKRQLNFSDGYCYDPEMRKKRSIRPSDGAKLSTGYPYPKWDGEKDKKLDWFLDMIFPDPGVKDYWLSLCARCLDMIQTQVKVLLMFGTGGGGKGTVTRLLIRSFGENHYGLPADKELFTKSKNASGGEGPTSARMTLENKLTVVANEVAGFDVDTVKNWTGNDKIPGRDLFGKHRNFPPRYNLITFCFNNIFKMAMDTGLRRRLRVIKIKHEFVEATDEEHGLRLEKEARENGEMNKHAMWTERQNEIVSLGPQLFARLVDIHQRQAFVEDTPEKVTEWTEELSAAASDDTRVQEFMETLYTSCGCKPVDGEIFDGTMANLVEADKSTKCRHFVRGADIMHHLKRKILDDGNTLYKSVKGAGRSDAPIHAMLRKVKINGLRLHSKKYGDCDNCYFGLTEKSAFTSMMRGGLTSNSNAT